MIIIKRLFLLMACTAVFLCFGMTDAMAARKTELPAKMMEKSHVNSYSSVVTGLNFYDYQNNPQNHTTRIYYNYKSSSNYVALILKCYDHQGMPLGEVDFNPYVNYADVPETCAMVELMPKNPADDTDTYLYSNYVNVYSKDGRVTAIYDLQIPLYKAVGWYPPVVVYAADGRELTISPFEVDAYAAVGWFTKEYFLYNSIKDIYGQYKNVGDFRSGMQMISDYIPVFREDTYINGMYCLKNEAMENWRNAAGTPLVSLGHEISAGFMGSGQVSIEFINLDYRTVKEFKVQFDCLDSSGNKLITYYDTYRAGEANLKSGEVQHYSWSLYGAYGTSSISNITVTEILYEDGTCWTR